MQVQVFIDNESPETPWLYQGICELADCFPNPIDVALINEAREAIENDGEYISQGSLKIIRFYDADNCLGRTILENVLIDVKSNGKTDTIELQIEPNVICRGNGSYGNPELDPGVIWNPEFYPSQGEWNYAAEVIAYCINEGSLTESFIGPYDDSEGEHAEVSWRVKPASIETLRAYRIID